jgi:RimJ/RimL family protein N-acetyltransferase
MNADPGVREFLGGVLTRDDAAASMDSFRFDLGERGWGWWVVEVRETGEFAGMAGLDPMDPPLRGIEIGWRLARTAWGFGYATEAARAILGYAFGELGLSEVYAIAAAGNERSLAVMRRLGMEPAGIEAPDGEVAYRIERA